MTQDPITLCTRLTRADVAGLIEALVESLKEGNVKIQKSDACCTLDVPRVVDLEVEGGTRGDRTVFRIEVSWRTNPPEIPDETEASCPAPAGSTKVPASKASGSKRGTAAKSGKRAAVKRAGRSGKTSA